MVLKTRSGHFKSSLGCRIGVVGLETGRYVELVVSVRSLDEGFRQVAWSMEERHGEPFAVVRALVFCAMDGSRECCDRCGRPCREDPPDEHIGSLFRELVFA